MKVFFFLSLIAGFVQAMPLAFTNSSPNEIMATEPGKVSGADALSGTIVLDSGATPSQVIVFLKDRDGHWYQNLLVDKINEGTNTWHCSLTPDTTRNWHPNGHELLWNHRSRLTPELVGVRVFPATAKFLSLNTVTNTVGHEIPPITHFIRQNASEVNCFELFETRFRLPDRYDNPFNPDEIKVDALITLPSAETIKVPCFYIQDYCAVSNLLEHARMPCGMPEWALRYSPTVPGPHTCVITAKDVTGITTSAPISFIALPADSPQFIRISQNDHRRFECGGREFLPIGHNIRSPFDTRMDDQFPWQIRHPEGFLAYQRYFTDMAKAGENMSEVWMCQWSLGIEWSTNAPFYHGIGDYNLGNAWELDRVLEYARASGIRINLVLNNHGRAGLRFDAEWPHSPYNVACGGFLPADDPMQFFSDPRALEYQKRIARYIVARWGWDSTVFAWELWSELDLCGRNDTKPAPQFDPNVINWHAEMGDYLKSIDINKHLVSTHLSNNYKITSPDLAKVKQLDHCCVDAYHYSSNPRHIIELINGTANMYREFDKPVLITEFGGTPMGAGLTYLKEELHTALWTSVCTPLAGTPFFWWWGVIEENDFYPMYTAVKNYCDGSNRIDPALIPVRLSATTQTVSTVAMANGTNLFAWIYTVKPYSKEASTCGITWAPVSNGTYRVDFCSTETGLPVKRNEYRAINGSLSFASPIFTNNIAVKIYKKETIAVTDDNLNETSSSTVLDTGFKITASITDNGSNLSVTANFASDYHLYADLWTVKINGATVQPLTEIKHIDDDVDKLIISPFTALYALPFGTNAFSVSVTYTGCSGDTCFLPQESRFSFHSGTAAVAAMQKKDMVQTNAPLSATSLDMALNRYTDGGNADGYITPERFVKFLSATQTSSSETSISLTRILLFLLAGLALNLTPCVLPMIPVQLAILGIGKKRTSKRNGFKRGLIFGLGMACAYGILGIVVVLTGAVFGTLQSSPWFNLAITALFVILALALLDVINIDFSHFNKAKANLASAVAVFSLGATSALLAGACVAPAVISVVVIAGSLYSDGHTAAMLLPFTLGIGMALPWPFIGAGIATAPRPGGWMKYVKLCFALIVLTMAFHYGRLAYDGFKPSKPRTNTAATGHMNTLFIPATDTDDLIYALNSVTNDTPILLDFWATWCKNCSAMEKKVFIDEAVRTELARFTVIKIQAEDPADDTTHTLLNIFDVHGLPAYRILTPKH